MARGGSSLGSDWTDPGWPLWTRGALTALTCQVPHHQYGLRTVRSPYQGVCMDPRPASDRSDEELGVLLASVSARLNRLYGRVLGQLDPALTFRQYRLLMRVAEGHTSMAALAAFGNLTVPTVSESIDALVRRGLMSRRENPENRRTVLLAVTSAGREAKASADSAMASVNRDVLQNVASAHRESLHESLAIIFDSATARFQGQTVLPSDLPPRGSSAARDGAVSAGYLHRA